MDIGLCGGRIESDVHIECVSVVGCVAAVLCVSGGFVWDNVVGYEPVGLFGLSSGDVFERGCDGVYCVCVGYGIECVAVSVVFELHAWMVCSIVEYDRVSALSSRFISQCY